MFLSLDRISSNCSDTKNYTITQEQCLEANYYSTLNLRVKNSQGYYEWIYQKPNYDEDEEAVCSYSIWRTEKRILIFFVNEKCLIGRKRFYMLTSLEKLEYFLESDIEEYSRRLKITLD